MAVPKIAIIAIIAILAVPILLGYGMNLTEVTVSEYKASDDSINTTQLLMNGTDYSTAAAETYQLNTNFMAEGYIPIYPIYINNGNSMKTSFPYRYGSTQNWSGETQNLTYCREYVATLDYTYSATSYIKAEIYSSGTLIATYNNIIYIHYDQDTDTIDYVRMTGINNTFANSISGGSYTSVVYSSVGGQTATRHWEIIYNDGRNTYTDFSGGFYFAKSQWTRTTNWDINLPQKTRSVLMTLDLNSVSTSSYSITINGITLSKTTSGGVVSWTASRLGDSVDLYYDSNISHNTYQVLFEYPDISRPSTNPGYPDPYREYYRHIEFRYVGDWSEYIGDSNYYQKYELEYWMYATPSTYYLDKISVSNSEYRTLTMRIDAAQFLAFEYQVIEDNTYQPSAFKVNPTTKLSNVQQTGTQLIFGGHTYQVKENKITIGTHQIPLENLIFSSVPNGSGTYDNMIGNTVVSTTADPSTIQFIGKWMVNVNTASMEQYSYNKTEWTAGQSAWDGFDSNFMIVGLITSLLAFIGLAIYSKRSKTSLWPLMLVCGGAAALFLFML